MPYKIASSWERALAYQAGGLLKKTTPGVGRAGHIAYPEIRDADCGQHGAHGIQQDLLLRDEEGRHARPGNLEHGLQAGNTLGNLVTLRALCDKGAVPAESALTSTAVRSPLELPDVPGAGALAAVSSAGRAGTSDPELITIGAGGGGAMDTVGAATANKAEFGAAFGAAASGAAASDGEAAASADAATGDACIHREQL